MKRIKPSLTKNFKPGAAALALALTLGTGGTARAQSGDSYAVGDEGAARTAPDANANRDEINPESSKEQGPVRLARFSYIQGNVTWREDESAAWSDASVNLPVRQGAQIWVAEHGRAEIQFDDGTLLRLGGGALVTLQTLYSDAEGEFTEIKLNQGLASLRVKHERSVYQVDTPYVSVKSSGPSKLRIGAGEAVEVAVREGDASVEGGQGRADLHSGDYLYLENADAGFAIRRLPRADSWEQWNEDRDALLEDAADGPSRRHLPPNIALVAPDLDSYGSWRNDPEYGYVWCPRGVESDWRPYYAGRWTWVQPFGWTWVSSEPWGWAPYHYGTWRHASYGWAWCPGPVTQYWSPGVVHFVETGGSVSWCPLAPHEVRYPAALSVGFRGGDWSAFFSIGQAAVYYPSHNNYCEARPWNSYYVNHNTYISNVTNVYNNVNYVQNHNTVGVTNFTPINAQNANGATSASLAAFSGRGVYRALPSSEAGVFTQGRSVLAPQRGQRPVAGPVSVRPNQGGSLPTRLRNSGAAPSAVVANRTVFRAPLPQNVQRSVGNAPQPGRAPQSNPNGGFSGRNTGGAPGGYTGRTTGSAQGGYAGRSPGSGPSGSAGTPQRTEPTGSVRRMPGGSARNGNRPEGNPTRSESSPRTDGSQPGTRRMNPAPERSPQPGNAPRSAGDSGGSAAERAQAARQSVGFGRRLGSSPATPGSGASGRSEAPRPGYSRPNPAPTPGRSENPQPTRTETPIRREQPAPQRTEQPIRREQLAPTRSEPPRQEPTRSEPPRREAPTPTRSEPPRSEPPHRDSGGSGGSGGGSGPQPGRRRG